MGLFEEWGLEETPSGGPAEEQTEDPGLFDQWGLSDKEDDEQQEPKEQKSLAEEEDWGKVGKYGKRLAKAPAVGTRGLLKGIEAHARQGARQAGEEYVERSLDIAHMTPTEIAQMVREQGGDPQSEKAKKARAKEAEKARREFADAIGETAELLPESTGEPAYTEGPMKHIEAGTVGMTEFAPSMAVSAVSPPAGLAATYLQLHGSKYEERLSKGDSDEKAFVHATLNAVTSTPAEFAGNILGLKALKASAKALGTGLKITPRIQKVLGAWAMGAVGEGGEETIQTYTETFVDVAMDAPPEATPQDIIDVYQEVISSPEFKQQRKESMLAGVAGGSAIPGLGGAVGITMDVGKLAARAWEAKGLTASQKEELRKNPLLTAKDLKEEDRGGTVPPTSDFQAEEGKRDPFSGLGEPEAETAKETKTEPKVQPAESLNAGLGLEQYQKAKQQAAEEGKLANQVRMAQHARQQEISRASQAKAEEEMQAQIQAKKNDALKKEQIRAREDQVFMDMLTTEQGTLDAASDTAARLEEIKHPAAKPIRALHKALTVGTESPDKLNSLAYDLNETLKDETDNRIGALGNSMLAVTDARIKGIRWNEQVEKLRAEEVKQQKEAEKAAVKARSEETKRRESLKTGKEARPSQVQKTTREKIAELKQKRRGQAEAQKAAKAPGSNLRALPRYARTPEFKNTGEAIKFGQTADEATIARLDKEYQEESQKAQDLVKAGKYQEAMIQGTKAQYIREAAEAGKGKIKPRHKKASADEALGGALHHAKIGVGMTKVRKPIRKNVDMRVVPSTRTMKDGDSVEKRLFNQMSSEGALDEVEAVFDPLSKRLYVFSETVDSVAHAKRAAWHEMGHFSLDDIFGFENKMVLNHVAEKFKDEVDSNLEARYSSGRREENRLREAEEVLIERFTKYQDPTATQIIKKGFRKLAARLNMAEEVSEDMIDDVVKTLRQNLLEGKSRGLTAKLKVAQDEALHIGNKKYAQARNNLDTVGMEVRYLRSGTIKRAIRLDALRPESVQVAEDLVAFNKLNKKLRDSIRALRDKKVLTEGRSSLYNLNKALEHNPALAKELAALEKKTGVKITDKDGNLLGHPIEARMKPGPKGELPKFGAFLRSMPQMYLDNMDQRTREAFRSDMVRWIERAYEKGGSDFNRTLKQLGTSDLGIAPAIRSAEKTLGAINLNSICPMFNVGSHGCYFDGCYVTGMGAGGNGINFYRSAIYTGELLQLSDTEIKKLNAVGGLRVNGVGDTSILDIEQWRDVFRHAAMRGLKLKFITKQADTLKMIDKLQKDVDTNVAKTAKETIVQPSVDPYWIPVSEDDFHGSFNAEMGLSKAIKKRGKAMHKEVAKLYKDVTGREAKVIDGILYRKYGFSPEQLSTLSKKYPKVRVQPRVVVGSFKEIADTALNNPKLLQTWMHAKIRPGMYSTIEKKVLNDGEVGNFTSRIWIGKEDGKWAIKAQGPKKDTTPVRKDTYTNLENYIKENYTKQQQEKIFKTLSGQLAKNPSALCCAAGASPDACNDCTSHCHNGTAYTGEELDRIAQDMMSDYSAEENEQLAASAPARWSRTPKGKEPKKTVTAYKLFRVDKKYPGKLFPLFVDADTAVPMGDWVDATDGGYHFIADNGRPYVPAKTGASRRIPNEKVKRDLYELGFIKSMKTKSIKCVAYRPGWHAGDMPVSHHLGEKSPGSKTVDTRSDNQVWAEVQMPADVDWQSEAERRALRNKDGSIKVATAQITDQIPVGGSYRYKTNPQMKGSWWIGGSMKITRVLNDSQVARLNKGGERQDLPRVKPQDLRDYGFPVRGARYSRVASAAIKVGDKVYTGTTHLDVVQKHNLDLDGMTKKGITDGFVTDEGDFVTREEAAEIVKEEDPRAREYVTEELRSEDLHNHQMARYARSPAVKAWLKDSKVKDVVYHGTNADFSEFRWGDAGIHFGSTPEQADDRLGKDRYDEKGNKIDPATEFVKFSKSKRRVHKEGTRVMPAVIKLRNPFYADFDAGAWTDSMEVYGYLSDMLKSGNAQGLTREMLDEALEEQDRHLKEMGIREYNDYIYENPDVSFLQQVLRKAGFDGVVYPNHHEGVDYEGPQGEREYKDSYIVFNANQIKTPWNPSPTPSPDVRYSRTPKADLRDLQAKRVRDRQIRRSGDVLPPTTRVVRELVNPTPVNKLHPDLRAIADRANTPEGMKAAFAEIKNLWRDGRMTEALQLRRALLKKAEEVHSARYTLAGKKALNAPLMKRTEAIELEKKGESQEQIWKKTGWIKTNEGRWAFEIDDSQMDIKVSKVKSAPVRLGDVVTHPELFAQYPHLKEMTIRRASLPKGTVGTYSPATGLITMDRNAKKQDFLDTAIHEMQHSIQALEGWSRGADMTSMDLIRTIPQAEKWVQKKLDYWKGELADREHYWSLPENIQSSDDLLVAEEDLEYYRMKVKFHQQLQDDHKMFQAMVPTLRPLYEKGRQVLLAREKAYLKEDWKEFNRLSKEATKFNRKIHSTLQDISSEHRGRNIWLLGYMHNLGEFMAKDTSLRRKMSVQERKETLPFKLRAEQAEVDPFDTVGSPENMPDKLARYSRVYDRVDNKSKKVLDNIGFNDQPSTQKVEKTQLNRAQRFVQKVLDSTHAIKVYEGDKQDVSTSGHKSFGLLSNFDNILNSFLNHGTAKFDNNWFIVDQNGPALMDVLKSLGPDAEMFMLHQTAKSAQEMINKGRSNLFGLDKDTGQMLDDQATVDQLVKMTSSSYQANKRQWDQAEAALKTINKSVLDFAVSANLINEEQRAEFERENYIPFFRKFEDEEIDVDVLFPSDKTKPIGKIHRLRGSERGMGDPTQNLIRSYSHMLHESLKNLARAKSLQPALQAGILEKGNILTKGRVIDIRVKGKAQYYKVHDEYLYDAITDLDAQTKGLFSDHWSAWILRAPKRLLTTGVTVAPAFRMANFLRDTVHTAFMNRSFVPVMSSIRGLSHAWRNTPEFIDFASTGGAFSGAYHQRDVLGGRAKNISKLHKEIVKGKPGALKRVWEFWGKIGEASENAARMGAYLNELSAGKTKAEAAYQAKDLLDFHKTGNAGFVKLATTTIPFLNARMQGLYKLGRSAVGKETRLKFWTMAAVTMAATSAYYYSRDDEEWFKQIPDHEKIGYWHFKVGSKRFRIPVPFEVGTLFSIVPLGMMEHLKGERTKSELADMYYQILRDTFRVDMPQVIKPMFQWATNYNAFTGSPIVPEGEQGLEPFMQYGPSTSKFSQTVGKVVNLSPRKIDQLLSDYFSYFFYVGAYVTDMGLSKVANFPEDPTSKLGDRHTWESLVGLDRFVRDKVPTKYTRAQEQFYKLAGETNKAWRTVKALATFDDPDSEKYLKDNELAAAIGRKIPGVRRRLGKLNLQMKMIYRSRDMSADEKRKELDDLIADRNETFKDIVRAIREYENEE